MRRRTPWLLLALTTALLLAANIARADAPTQSENQTAESVFTESVPEALRSWFGPATFPPRLTLKLLWWHGDCTEIGRIELEWGISGGVPPYTRTLDGQAIDATASGAAPTCGPSASDDSTPGAERIFRGGVTDSRGVTATDELRVPLTAPPPRAAPGAARYDASTGTALQLSWTAVNAVPSVSAYELQYQSTAWDATSWTDSWTAINDTIAASATEYLHRNLDSNRRYRYQLRARNGVDAGKWSRAFPEVGLRPGAPLLEARTAASGSVTLSWGAGPTGATRWEHRRRQDGGSWSTWTEIIGADASTAGHTVSGLTEDATYHFQLRAHTASGPGPAAATAIAVAGLTPSAPISLAYANYDATGGATAPGAFSLLANAADLSSGVADYADAPAAAALLVNAIGYAGSSHADSLDAVVVGDVLTWEIGWRCWFAYRVTALLSDPPAPARKLFAVELTARDPCVGPINAHGYIPIVRGPPPSEPRIGADGIRILPVHYPVEGGHTYRISDYGSPGWIVIDIPAGMRLTYTGGGLNSDATTTVTLEHEASGATLFLKFGTGSEEGRYIPTEPSSSAETQDVGALFDAIVESARRQPLPR